MSKTSLICEKIFTLEHPSSLKGIILIESELIAAVIQFGPDVSLAEIRLKYLEWNPIICENSYICPGIIDLSARNEWESPEILSKLAVSGGVTLQCLEKNLFNDSGSVVEKPTDIFYIDLIENLQTPPLPDVIAYKTYLYQPSYRVKSSFEFLLSNIPVIQSQNLPIFIDCVLPQDRLLYQVSPCRKLTLTERINFSPEKTSDFFSCAFPDEIQSAGSDEKIENESELKDKVLESPTSTVATIRKQSFSDGTRRLSLNFVYEELEEKIKQNQEDVSNLSLLEEMSYSNSGKTGLDLRNRSYSCNDEIYQGQEDSLVDSFAGRMNNKRPAPLVIKESCREREDLKYLNFVSKIPESWELSGIKLVSSKISQFSVPVHITKLSSAAAVNKVRKLSHLNFTCDVSSHHLYLNDSDVPDGVSELKDFPPIRSKKNQDLLWEYLQLGNIHCVASHHTSVPNGLKKMSGGSFLQAISGVNTAGLTLPVLWTKALEIGGSDIDTAVDMVFKALSAGPAQVLRIFEKRGSIKEGKFADLVVWKPFEKSLVEKRGVFKDKNLFGKVEKVFVRGSLKFSC